MTGCDHGEKLGERLGGKHQMRSNASKTKIPVVLRVGFRWIGKRTMHRATRVVCAACGGL